MTTTAQKLAAAFAAETRSLRVEESRAVALGLPELARCRQELALTTKLHQALVRRNQAIRDFDEAKEREMSLGDQLVKAMADAMARTDPRP